MKKRAISMFVALVLMVMAMGSASAVDATETSELPHGNIIVAEGPLEFTKIDSSYLVSDSPDTSANDDTPLLVEPRSTFIDPVYFEVHPVILLNGEAVSVNNVFWDCPMPIGSNFIATYMTSKEQNDLINPLKERGYEPIGWFVVGAYNIGIYNPMRWNFYLWTEAGQGNLNSARAQNGITEFRSFTLYPETPREYKCGMSGTISYQVSAMEPHVVTAPVELSVRFEL